MDTTDFGIMHSVEWLKQQHTTLQYTFPWTCVFEIIGNMSDPYDANLLPEQLTIFWNQIERSKSKYEK